MMTPDEEVFNYLEAQMLRAARTLAERGEFTKSADVYRELAKSFPGRATTHRELAVVLLRAAQAAWFVWNKNRLASEALTEAGRANELETPHGDSLFVISEAIAMLNLDKKLAVIETLELAFVYFNRQLVCGEAVSPFYLDTAARLAERYEAQGQTQTALMMHRTITGAPALEAEGKLKPGTVKPNAIAKALASIQRLQGSVGQ